MENGINYWHIWNVDPTKIRVFPLFQIATLLITQNMYMILSFRLNYEK